MATSCVEVVQDGAIKDVETNGCRYKEGLFDSN